MRKIRPPPSSIEGESDKTDGRTDGHSPWANVVEGQPFGADFHCELCGHFGSTMAVLYTFLPQGLLHCGLVDQEVTIQGKVLDLEKKREILTGYKVTESTNDG